MVQSISFALNFNWPYSIWSALQMTKLVCTSNDKILICLLIPIGLNSIRSNFQLTESSADPNIGHEYKNDSQDKSFSIIDF